MTTMTSSRLGQVNQAGAVDALFLDIYGGEVLTAFRKNQTFMERHSVRTIANGKSASFPRTGKASAAYHVVGEQILGEKMNHGETVITVDDLLISSKFIANVDEAKNHFDVRSIYTAESGEALAQQYDKHVATVGLNAARSANPITGLAGGTIIESANYKTNGATLATGIFDMAQAFDEKDISSMERACFVKPAQYYMLAQTTSVINKDWGGEGSYAAGSIIRIADIEIVKTNNLPTTAQTGGFKAIYDGNFSTTAALIMNKAAVGTVKLMDLAVESEYKIEYQGHLMVAKYLMGHGVLRPECAGELRTSTPV